MAFRLILLLAFVASTQAAIYLSNGFFGPQGFYPPSPNPPRGQQYQNYEPWNPFKIFENFPFMPFRPFPPNGFPMPTPADVASMVPGPNQNFNGMSVSSTSFFTKDKDGNLVNDGGTTVLINDNGNIHQMTLGKSPPGVNEKVPPIVLPEIHIPEFVMPPLPEIPELSQMHQFPLFFPPIRPIPPIKPIPPMEPIYPVQPLEPINNLEIKPINFDDINKAKPGDNENTQIIASSSHSQYSDVDGVQNSSGGSHTMVNINGDVRQEMVEFDTNPKGGLPRGDKNPGGVQRPDESNLSMDSELGKESKPINATKPNNTKLGVNPKGDLN